MILIRAIVCLAALLAGCASAPEAIRVPERVYLDRPVPCIPPAGAPTRPALRSGAEIASMDTYRATHALWAAYAAAAGYIGELEAVVAGCARLPEIRNVNPSGRPD